MHRDGRVLLRELGEARLAAARGQHVAPSEAHRRATARPIPDEAPVTRTARPSSVPMGAIAYGRADRRPSPPAALTMPSPSTQAGHMEFLVNINVALPSGMPDDRRQELYAAEAVQAASLAAAGRLVRLWRYRDAPRNWGLARR